MKPRLNRRYADMFDFVPIGFFTLGRSRILEVNSTGAGFWEPTIGFNRPKIYKIHR